jgi:tripartite-type tricarboxylate transporter receptor subunit TctC
MGDAYRRRRLLAALGAGAAGALLPRTAIAQTFPAWPLRPIRIVVGFPPGGLTDAYARMYGEQLGAATGQTVIVENKPGAGAIIAIEAVAKAPPDGYTLLMTTSGAVWQNRVLYRKLPFDLDRDITPITVFPSGPLVVAVAEKVPVRSFPEFIAWAKKNPTSMGSYAPASYPHMVADQINRSDGTNINSVHYKGESPMWVDLATGQTQIAIGSYQAFATVQARGVRPIGVTGMNRCPKLPDVPTLVEQGVTAALVRLEGGLPLTAPTGVPEYILQKLAQVAVNGAETARAAQLRENFGIPDKPRGLEETRKFWREVPPQWIRIAAELGIKLD